MRRKSQTASETGQPAAPEWASRLLRVPEGARIIGVHVATYYRGARDGIYPEPARFNGISRVPGWELWEVVRARLAERDAEGEAA